jgi:hypothetical protein
MMPYGSGKIPERSKIIQKKTLPVRKGLNDINYSGLIY